MVVPGGVGADGVHDVIPALLSLVERLARHNVVLVVATEQVGAPVASYELRGARVVCLGRKRRGPLGRVRLAWSMLAELRRFRPDVIHALWLGPGSTLSIVAGRILGVPVVGTIGGGETVAIRRIGYGGARTWRGRQHVSIMLRLGSAVTAGSRYALTPILPRRPDARWLPLGAERTANSVASDDAAPTTTRLLVVASVNRVKGPEVVLGAIAKVHGHGAPDIHLDWVGEDTLAGASTALARSLGLADIVSFRGFEPHTMVLARIAAADLLVQGSHHEGQGVAVLEAAMGGLPTVGTAVGLVVELAAADPPAAIAVPAGDASALADAIVELTADPPRRAALGAAARAWAAMHDADWTAAAFEAIYAEVTGRR